MAIEVEQKFPIADPEALARRLADLEHCPGQTVEQIDCYFAHPARDFAVTDEALRLRRVGQNNYITYKGPKLDAETKSRREIEIAFADGRQPADAAAEMLLALGFRRVAEVTKRRTHSTVRWQNRQVEVSLDEVAGLGNFVELEIVAVEEDFAAARECLASLASHLELRSGERRSYLELLFERGS